MNAFNSVSVVMSTFVWKKNEFRNVHTRADAKRCVKTRVFQTFSIINVTEGVSQGCLSNKTRFVAFFSKEPIAMLNQDCIGVKILVILRTILLIR